MDTLQQEHSGYVSFSENIAPSVVIYRVHLSVLDIGVVVCLRLGCPFRLGAVPAEQVQQVPSESDCIPKMGLYGCYWASDIFDGCVHLPQANIRSARSD